MKKAAEEGSREAAAGAGPGEASAAPLVSRGPAAAPSASRSVSAAPVGGSLNELEARIAALEAEMAGEDSEADGGEESDDASDSESEPSPSGAEGGGPAAEGLGAKRRLGPGDGRLGGASPPLEKKAKKAAPPTEILSNAAELGLERIPPLPAHLLPEAYATISKQAARRRASRLRGGGGVEGPQGGGAAAGPLGGAGGGGAAKATAAGDAGVPMDAPGVAADAPLCRECRRAFPDTAALLRHRATGEHKATSEAAKRASFCNLCQKQFTSVEQRMEHERGRWHVQRLATVRARAPPQAASGGGRPNLR